MQKLIFDIGMHIGRDTEFYLKKGFRVVAVEANPELARQANDRFSSEIRSGQLTIVNRALVEDQTEQVEFYVNDDKNDWGTLLPDWNRSLNRSFRKITVPTIRLNELIANHGMPYYMKIDIEGADVMCVRSLMSFGKTPEYVSVELMTPNNLAEQKVECLEILVCLRAMGFTKFQISDQSRLKSVKCPRPPLEGNYVDYEFDGHSSGLFGKELQTPVYTIDEVAERYLAYFYARQPRFPFSLCAGGPPNNPFHRKGWFDIHAGKG
jgi:FkbM family methyltransferase